MSQLHDLIKQHNKEKLQSALTEYKKNPEALKYKLHEYNKEGLTPLHVAFEQEEEYFGQFVSMLVEAGADINFGCRKFMYSILHNAVQQENSYNKLIYLLDNYKGKINLETKDKSGNTVLAVAVTHNNKDAIRSLLNAGAEINAVNEANETIFHGLADLGNFGLAKHIINCVKDKSSINFNIKDKLYNTPLHKAVYKKNLKFAKLLLYYGADASIKGQAGNLASHYAALNQDAPMLKMLITATNVDVYAENDSGCTIFHLLKEEARKELNNLLGKANIYFLPLLKQQKYLLIENYEPPSKARF